MKALTLMLTGSLLLTHAVSAQESADIVPDYRITPDDFHPRDSAKETLGQLLFFDKILSDKMNIFCASCHHPLTGTGDGLSLPVGKGGYGLGVTRNTGMDDTTIIARVPRNAPSVFDLRAHGNSCGCSTMGAWKQILIIPVVFITLLGNSY